MQIKKRENKRLVCQTPLFFGTMMEGNKFMKKLLLLLLLSVLLIPSSVRAADPFGLDIAPQPCDAQYWRQMSARAWLESEREIMQNQNLIFKPDSVLEYVCFDQFASIAAWPGGDIFVHTKYFGKKIIERATDGALEKALTQVVTSSAKSYQNKNFAHDYLGGRAGMMNSANKDYQLKASLMSEKKNYTCQEMSKIWKTAKCANFVDNNKFEDTDGFYPFEAIKKHGEKSKDVAGYADKIKETRQYPTSLKCSDDLGVAGTWEDQIKLATNETDNLYAFHTPLGTVFKDIGDKLKPGACGKKGIKTGVKVITKDGEHDDGVCTNPGCSWTKGGTCQ